MNITEPKYENKFIMDGIQSPVHCICLNIEKHSTKSLYPHYHEYIEILYSIESDCDVYINGKITPFNTGDLVILNSGENHDLIFEKGSGHYAVIKVLPEILYSSEQSVF